MTGRGVPPRALAAGPGSLAGLGAVPAALAAGPSPARGLGREPGSGSDNLTEAAAPLGPRAGPGPQASQHPGRAGWPTQSDSESEPASKSYSV